MPELVFFSGTMDCGKSTDLLGYSPCVGGVVGGVVSSGAVVVCSGGERRVGLLWKVPFS
jgi:hypothetical protein